MHLQVSVGLKSAENEPDVHPLQVGLTSEPLKRAVGGLDAGRGHATTRRVHQCPCCHYTTMYHSHLREHYRTHTGERPFACSHCVYQAATKRDLKKHIRTHTGEKRFACPLCLYRSANSSDLKKHSRTHNRSKFFWNSSCYGTEEIVKLNWLHKRINSWKHSDLRILISVSLGYTWITWLPYVHSIVQCLFHLSVGLSTVYSFDKVE